MSELSLFLKSNKTKKENVYYAATESIREPLLDEKGSAKRDGSGEVVTHAILWELRHITTKEKSRIQDECIKEIPVPGKPGMFRPKMDTNKYIAKLIVAAVVSPNLMNAELQDSYGVKTPEDLVQEMVDDPGEYDDLAAFVQKMNGYDISMDEKVEAAKN